VSIGGCVCGSCKFCKPQNYTENGIFLKGREQVSDYTPTTEEVRQGWRTARTGQFYVKEQFITDEEFDRWLAEVKADAWDEGYVSSDDYYGEHDNPYRGDNK